MRVPAALLLLPLVSACEQGDVTVLLTDAPADGLTRFEITLRGVDIEGADGSFTEFDFDPPRVVDIVPLRNGNTTALLQDAGIDSGDYTGIRLRFETDERAPGESLPVARENGDQLQLAYVEDTAEVAVSFGIDDLGSETLLLDLDLRRSVREDDDDIADGQLRFDPRLRAVINDQRATLSGVIGPAIYNQAGCLPAVYLFEDLDRDPAGLADDNPPLASTVASIAEPTGRGYRIGALEAGEYTAAVTCDAAVDDPESDEVDTDITFETTANVRLRAGETVTRNFP